MTMRCRNPLLVLLLCVSAGLAENLIRNPGFEVTDESGPAHWTTRHTWYEKPKGSGLADVSLDTDVFQGPGRRSLRLEGQANRGLAQQQIAVKQEWGKEFVLSGWIRLHETGSACGRIGTECIGSDGTWLGSGAALVTDWRKSTADWERFEKRFRLKPGTQAIRVHCAVAKAFTGTVWFDNLALEPVSPEPISDKPVAVQETSAAHRKADETAGKAIEALIPIDDFENQEMAWRGNAWGGAIRPEFELVKDRPRFGKQCLRVRCPSAKGNMVDRTWNYDGPWDAISLWVRRVSGTGGMTLYIFCEQVVFHATWFNPGPEWGRVTARVEEFRYAWGAKDDKQKVFDPDKVTKISFGHEDVISFDVDHVALDTDEGLILRTAYTERRGNLFQAGERPTVTVEMINANTEPTTAILDADLAPWSGPPISVSRQTLTLAPRSYTSRRINIPPLAQAYSSARVRLLDRGRVVGRHAVGLCVLPQRVPGGRAFMGASGFGMGATRADLGHQMGVQASEIMVNWKTAEPQQGEYRIDGIAAALDAFERYGFQTTAMILISPSRTPEWALPDRHGKTRQGASLTHDAQAFAAFVEQVARRYGDRFHDYSFCCEIDLLAHRLDRGTDGYVALVEAGAAAIRSVDPDAVIGGIGVSGGDARKRPRFPVARALWQRLHQSLDGFFFDAYASPRYYGEGLRVMEPEENDLVGMLEDAVALVRQYGPEKRVAIQEKGWAIDTRLPVDAAEARAMAACLTRSYLLARSVDAIQHYMWFQVDTGRGEGQYSYSLFRHEGDYRNPRPAVAAYAWTARFLAGAEAPRRIPLHQDIFAFVFSSGEGARAALWTPLDNAVTLDVILPDGVRATDMLGNELSAADLAEGLALSSEPVLLWSDNVSAARLAAALEAGTFRLPCAALAVTRPATDVLRIHVRNLLSGPLKGTLLLDMAAGWQLERDTIPVLMGPSDATTVTIPVKHNTSGQILPQPLRARLRSENHGTVTLAYEPQSMSAHRLSTPPVIDAELTEYSAFEPFALNGQTYLDPPDAPAAGLWTGVDDLSADIYVAWDDEALYVAAKVRDDAFVQEQTGSRIWANDALQIAIDPLNNAAGMAVDGSTGYGEDDMEFGIALTPEGPQTYQWSGAPDGQGRLLQDAQLAVKRQDPFTVYEWALPWPCLGLDRAPSAKRVFGFNAVVLDADQKGRTARYWMGITQGICGGKNPALFRDLLLNPAK